MLLLSHFKRGDFSSEVFDRRPNCLSSEVEVVFDAVVEPPVSADANGMVAWQLTAGDGDVP